MPLKDSTDGVKAVSQKYLLASKFIRKSNQNLYWRQSNKKPIPGDELQRSSELQWIYGFPWMHRHGPKCWLQGGEGAVTEGHDSGMPGSFCAEKGFEGGLGGDKKDCTVPLFS